MSKKQTYMELEIYAWMFKKCDYILQARCLRKYNIVRNQVVSKIMK